MPEWNSLGFPLIQVMNSPMNLRGRVDENSKHAVDFAARCSLWSMIDKRIGEVVTDWRIRGVLEFIVKLHRHPAHPLLG